MILVYPPVARPTEPPAALGRLAGYLARLGIAHECIDGNAECFLHCYAQDPSANDTWTKRATMRKEETLLRLTGAPGYETFDAYVRDVKILSRVIAKSSLFDSRFTVSPTDYSDAQLSPYNSGDLEQSFHRFEENPYFEWFEKRIPAALADIPRSQPQWLGLSVSYLSQVLTAFAIAGFTRNAFPSIKIVLGGGLLRSWMGLGAFDELCARLEMLPWYDEGEAFVDAHIKIDGKIPYCNAAAGLFTVPDYSFAEKNTYVSPGRVLSYSPTLGCSYRRCAFCSETFEGMAFSTPGNDAAYQGYLELSRRYRPAGVHFCDHEMSPGLLRRLADGGAHGAPWYGFSRVIDDFLDPVFCESLSASGCKMLCLGIESGSQRVLDAMEKGIEAVHAGTALTNLAKAGVRTFCYFLFGTPWEDEASAAETAFFIKKHSEYIHFANLSIFNLPSRSPVSAKLDTKRFYGGDLSLYWDFSHPHGWNRKKVRSFISKELLSDKHIRRIIQRTPPVFSSSHAAFIKRIG